MTKVFTLVPKKRSSLKTRLIASEYQECVAFYEWTQLQTRLKGNVIKIVNEGQRSLIGGHMLKRIGLRKGVPDYFIPIPTSLYHGLWIEMKRKNAKNYTSEQIEWIVKLYNFGYKSYIAYGADQAIQVTLDYLSDKI